MTFDWIQELPSTDTPLTKKFFERIANSILDVAFPIGKTEMFFDNEDHSNYMGFTWERTSEGCVPVGINANDSDFNEIGKIVGSKKHTLTIEEMPSHFHNYKYGNVVGGDGTAITYGSTTGTQERENAIKSTGGSQPHNNIQPSQVFAIWKRIA